MRARPPTRAVNLLDLPVCAVCIHSESHSHCFRWTPLNCHRRMHCNSARSASDIPFACLLLVNGSAGSRRLLASSSGQMSLDANAPMADGRSALGKLSAHTTWEWRCQSPEATRRDARGVKGECTDSLNVVHVQSSRGLELPPFSNRCCRHEERGACGMHYLPC
jgi:hypothetical protein